MCHTPDRRLGLDSIRPEDECKFESMACLELEEMICLNCPAECRQCLGGGG